MAIIQSGELYISKDKRAVYSVSEIVGSGCDANVHVFEIALKGFTHITFKEKDYYRNELSTRTDRTEKILYLKLYQLIKSARKEILNILKNATTYDFEKVEIGNCYVRTIDRKCIYFIKDDEYYCFFDLLIEDSLSQIVNKYRNDLTIINTCKQVDNSVYQQITFICENLANNIDTLFENSPILNDIPKG